jgi:hypothetical protein
MMQFGESPEDASTTTDLVIADACMLDCSYKVFAFKL